MADQLPGYVPQGTRSVVAGGELASGHTGKIHTPLGDAPVLPLMLIMLGGYLLWFGIHYWRDQTTIWPSDPLKDVLQGKGVPVPNREQSVLEDVQGADAQTQKSIAEIGEVFSVGATLAGQVATGQDLAAVMAKYVGKVKYAWGGASPATGADCSGLVNYAACNQLKLDIPGIKGGDFTGKPGNHGPDVASWLAWLTGVTVLKFADIEIGDIVAWGPNKHMGVAVSTTEFVSAANPKQGTIKAPIKGFFSTLPIVLRLKEVDAKNQVAGISGPGGTADVQGNKNTAKLLAGARGWGSGDQWSALEEIWQEESSWSQFAQNASSGAYGIPQALPATKLPTAGQPPPAGTSDVTAQINWGLDYIASRYGTPVKALAFHKANGWY